MSKSLYIAEKPSVAREFANALKLKTRKMDGYLESDEAVITWCVGHLVTMSYPEAYDAKLKRWSLDTLPFLPEVFKYEIIKDVSKQFHVVKELLGRSDIDVIYVCTDSGREGEYIYRLVEQMADVKGKARKRVWIDSQTEEEILRGIQTAKELSEYDNLSASAYLRAKEDYLMGINFSRLLTLKYGNTISNFLKKDWTVLSVGRVMTCVLGMVVRREREIRDFVKTPFYRVLANTALDGELFEAEWKAVEGSLYYQSPYLYKENGFKEKEKAQALVEFLREPEPVQATVFGIEKKKEKKNAPLLYNLAELQNECSKMFKLSPDQTLKAVQELYEKKLVTYPRTDARVLSTAVAKEIYKNIGGLQNVPDLKEFAAHILASDGYKSIARSRYVNDKQITDHYAIIPTGQGFGALRSLAPSSYRIYELIARRFLSIFYPPAVYQKISLELKVKEEHFFATFRILIEKGYLEVSKKAKIENENKDSEKGEDSKNNPILIEALMKLKKGTILPVEELFIKEGETTPPKRYSSGSMILAMENAGQLIEDDSLREQIKGSGIGTSATRAEILKKLVHIEYLALNQKTQIITPTLFGEAVYEVVDHSIRQLLNPELTASWEKGLTYVAEGEITPEEYMVKLESFIRNRTAGVLHGNHHTNLRASFQNISSYYKK